jgi:hypothetical protein
MTRLRRCPNRVTTGKAQIEHKFSGSLQLADINEPCRHFRVVPEADLSNRSKATGYSITSSARASSVAGTSRPSSLAVLRLITNSNLVG